MGFRIYNGIKFEGCKTLEDVYALAGQLRPLLVEQADEVLSKALVERAIHPVDKALVAAAGLAPATAWTDDPLWAATIDVEKRRKQAKQEGYRHPDVDVACDMAVVLHETGLYGVIYCEVDSMRKIIRSHPGIVSFSWGNDECPDDMQESEWDARGEVWRDIFKTHDVIADIGVNFSLVRDNHFTPTFSKGTIVKPDWLPSFESRVFSAALDTDAARQMAPAPSSAGEMVRYLSDLRKGKYPAFTEIYEQVAKLLPQEVTMEWIDSAQEKVVAMAQQRWLDQGIPMPHIKTRAARM